ncbi:DUF3274 domain-containing protein [Enterobacteriaceae bacterium 89]|nr:DUF3274 domain-containing protein [Enterobacteriaceae bacterium 89]
MSNSPFNERTVARNVQGVPKTTGAGMETHEVIIKPPMPCIVILVHGVNDVGEAYQTQEAGIIAGLNERMSRDDMYPHTWHQYKMDNGDGEQMRPENPGRSPVIPFYWGYKPVEHLEFVADQSRYKADLARLKDDADLPYNAYQENNPKKMASFGNDGKSKLKFSNDNFGNVLDDNFAKCGGTFANATTNIPDMLGPGADGLTYTFAKILKNHVTDGDYTHVLYDNPHRIYQFFAAQRLADLILTIRRNKATEKDVINIVAHSQGTIVTMLANMLVKQQGNDPVNCVILNNSPYALECTLAEKTQPGHHQTDNARQQTFKNFCKLMRTGYEDGKCYHTDEDIKKMNQSLNLPGKNKWKENPLYARNNFGKVYNYFTPNDGTVSLVNVQGMGWRGIPETIAGGMINLRQRVFFEDFTTGDNASPFNFSKPEYVKGQFEYDPLDNATYKFSDVVINGEQLPSPFKFTLQGADNKNAKYTGEIDPDSPDQTISYSAKASKISRTVIERKDLNWLGYNKLVIGHSLTKEELAIYDHEYLKEELKTGGKYLRGVVKGTNNANKYVELVRLKSRNELEKEWQKNDPVGFSQHSSIVTNKDVAEKAVAFDLAIGQCKSFDYRYGKFWMELVSRADWRNPRNKNVDAIHYYKTGLLNHENTKVFMNKPNHILPTGEFGVVNEYNNPTSIRPAQRNEIHNKEIANPQWDMPKTINV